MYGIFKKKSKKEKLQEQYQKLMAEAHRLSTTNRKRSDDKIAEAEQIMQEIDKLQV
jgi:hypothetical protein